jgi:hypothetical protein
MPYLVDFTNVSTTGLESSPVANRLAGLRANEARYFKKKYNHDFTVQQASNASETIDYVHRVLEKERGLVIESRPLEATIFQVENIRWAYVSTKTAHRSTCSTHQRALHARQCREAAGGDHPGFVFFDQGRVLISTLLGAGVSSA